MQSISYFRWICVYFLLFVHLYTMQVNVKAFQIFTNLTFACQLSALPVGQSGPILSLDRVARSPGELFLRRPYSVGCNPCGRRETE